jgi:hypothetical protein
MAQLLRKIYFGDELLSQELVGLGMKEFAHAIVKPSALVADPHPELLKLAHDKGRAYVILQALNKQYLLIADKLKIKTLKKLDRAEFRAGDGKTVRHGRIIAIGSALELLAS